MTLRELEAQVTNLKPAEKAQLLQRLANEVVQAWPGIESTPGVCGRAACVVRTRIPVWTLENYRRLGWTEARILQNFPTLHAVDLANAWAYAAAHITEIDGDIAAQ